ncbi:hypothetical protein NW069_03880 [Mycoplasmopsis cynos]|uniref:hypothetical protein n=2 Tax=Mycoplasmopsis cynos TaxID=171284 RepID=UPI0022035E5B|nr:hypothetical protein [Mycoplasmopsis cynos]UWV80443.1 hypothetical protein NW069_03880 [Mycoplasmopsis cynos]
MQPYKTELDKFWTQNKGDWLRADIRKNKWFTSIPDNIINPVDPDKYRFVTYELLLKKLRTRKTPTEVKRIVDVEVEQYKALFEFRQAYENSNSANIPAKVKDSLKHKILNVSTDATKVQMDQITKYLGQRITTGNNVTSGFYLDAKFLLDSIIQSNVGGKASNQSHYQKLFDVIGDPTPGHNNNDDVTEKIDNFRTQITKFIEKLKEAKNKVTEFKTKYGNDPKVSDFEAKLDKVVVILSTANDQGAQDLINEINNYISQLNTQKDDIKRLIMSLPYSNPSSTDAQKSKSILNKKVDNAKTKQELDDLNSEINALNTKMNEFINSLSSIPYDANKLKTAIETIKRALDKATTIQDVENILPDNWGQRISEYKTIINDSYLDQAPINNLLTRLNQTVPSTLRDNEPFPTGDYKENQLIDEILQEFKQESISTINQLSNLKTRQKTQFDNITKRVNDINPKNYQWNSIESAIMLIKQQTNDAIKLNYDLFIDNNLAYPSKSNLSSLVSETKKRIKMHLTSNVTRKTKADVERKLNELKTKIDMVKTKISKVKNIVQTSNKKDEFERELAQTDDQNIDNLIAKIDKYNHAITLLEQIKNDTDKINLKGNLSSASTLDQINDVIRDINVKISEINNAKLRAQNAINSIPDKYNTHKHSKNLKQEYTKQLMNKDNLSLDVLNKLIADAELEKYRFETQDWIDAKLDKYNNKGLNLYNKLNHNDQTPTRDSVDQIRKEVEAELEHIKKDITDRVRTELFDNATALYRRIDRNDKRRVYAEQSYYEWFKEEIKKQPSEMKVNELEYKFITERYAESVRIRAFLVSFQYNIEHSNEFNANQELRSNILNEIKKYATEYQTNDSRDDKFDGFTIYDFWRTFNLHLRDLEINRKLPANIKTVIRKLFSLSGQVEAPDANITTTQSEISNKVDKSIISKVLQKIKGNSIQNSQYTASEAYMIINVLFVKTISNKSGNTYDKILRLKSDNVFANIISGNGSKGLIQGAELWNSNLQKENS